LKKHDEKLKKASKLSDDEMDIAKYELFKHLNFTTLDMISKDYWEKAENLVSDIDIDIADIVFVTLTLYLQAYLWTGCKVLYNDLKYKGFDRILSTAELKQQLFW
jgi:predicted nucleic acid-binding protein